MTSVDNIEWVCRSCSTYLSKNKVPPCAIVKGMQFPPKPAFFDLNELECRLLAPRLAFQKLMQAPRGDNLKLMATLLMYQQMLISLLVCYQGYQMRMEQSTLT